MAGGLEGGMQSSWDAGLSVFSPALEFMKCFMHVAGAWTPAVSSLTVPQSNRAEGGDAEGF